MKKKKRAFTLLEVLVAILLAASCAYFLLTFQKGHVKVQQKAFLNLAHEKLLQEATCKLFEMLYTSEVSSETLLSEGSIEIPLSAKKTKAKASFSIEDTDSESNPKTFLFSGTVSLISDEKSVESKSATIYFCGEKK